MMTSIIPFPTWNMYVCLSGLVGVVLLDSTGEAVAVSLLHSHSAADSIEVIRTSDCLCRSSREEVSLTVQPEHLRFWIPASGFTYQQHSITDFRDLYVGEGNRT